MLESNFAIRYHASVVNVLLQIGNNIHSIDIGNAQSHYIYLSFYSVIIMFMCDVKFPHV